MTRVVVAPSGSEVQRRTAAPRRDVLSRLALDRLAAVAGGPSPVAPLLDGGSTDDGLAERLGAGSRPGPADGDAAEDALASAGLLASGAPTAEARALLDVWHAPALAVELEMLVALRSGTVRVRSRHHSRAGWVVCLSTADGEVFELGRLAAEHWWLELARAAHVDLGTLRPARRAAEAVPDVVETPWELLLATGEAVRRRRHDLLDQLVSVHSGTTLAGDATDGIGVAGDSDVRRWHERLETTSRGRLHAAVMGRSGQGRAGAGVVEWVLLPDGWRSLRPFTRNGWTMVRIERRAPADLPGELSLLAAEVTS